MKKETLDLQEYPTRPSTRKAYGYYLSAFDRWRKDREVNDETLTAFLCHQFENGKSPGAVKVALSAIARRAQSEDKPDPRGRRCRAAFIQYRIQGRLRGRGQVDPITWPMVDELCSIALGEKTLYGYRDAALFCVMSDALLRVGEASDAEVCHLDFGNRVLNIPRSKTDQEGIGAEQWLKNRTLEHVKRWLEKAKVKDGYIFRPIHITYHRVLKKPLSTWAIRKIIKDRCKQAGFKGRFSGHSFRVGTAVSIAAQGATDTEMMLAGRWKSPTTPIHYAQKQTASQSIIARLEARS